MVVALGPGKFYGSGLPRPRFYTDVKFNLDRVDPPTPVMDPLLSWANEAHWSMGGLSFKRHRLQGRIEGSIKKLRAHQERTERMMTPKQSKKRSHDIKIRSLDSIDWESSDSESLSKEEAEVKVEVAVPSSITRRKRARKLVDEFEMVAAEKEKKAKEVADRISSRTRSRRSNPVEPTVSPVANAGKARRTSPRKSAAQSSK